MQTERRNKRMEKRNEMERHKKISQITSEFAEAQEERCLELFAEYATDPRPGVKKIIERYQKLYQKKQKELQRLEQMKFYENKYAEFEYICGIDEVGRGPLAGPVVACAVILPRDCSILYLNDSKQLSEKKREELYPQILEQAISIGIGEVEPEEIDRINILQATYEAMRQAVAKLTPQPQLLLNDAVRIPGISYRQIPIVQGDAKSISIAAASIVAKVVRDRKMAAYDQEYPGYGFASNKGYGSAEHITALKTLGPCKLHRKSFLKNLLSEASDSRQEPQKISEQTVLQNNR